MVSKQLSWGRSNMKHILSLLILVTSFSLFSMDNEKKWWDQPKEILDGTFIKGTSLQQMIWAYQDAPEMIKDCVLNLNNPDVYHLPEYKALFLYGDPGSGKSTLAKAIAQYAGWDQEFYTPRDIQGTKRGKGAEKLRNLLDSIINRKEKTVVIFDEINQIMEHAESEYHDNDATSKEFWTYLDKVHGNNDFFLIGTANRLYHIPQQIKSRIKPFICKIETPININKKREIFLRHFETAWTKLEPKAHKFLDEIIKKYPTWTARDYADFSALCKIVYREKNKTSPVMTFSEQHLKEAFRRNAIHEEDLQYGEKELSTVEREELHFAQNHYIQILSQRQQKIPLNWSLGIISGGRSSGLKEDDGNWILNKGLSKLQKRLLFQELQQNLDGFDED